MYPERRQKSLSRSTKSAQKYNQCSEDSIKSYWENVCYDKICAQSSIILQVLAKRPVEIFGGIKPLPPCRVPPVPTIHGGATRVVNSLGKVEWKESSCTQTRISYASLKDMETRTGAHGPGMKDSIISTAWKLWQLTWP